MIDIPYAIVEQVKEKQEINAHKVYLFKTKREAVAFARENNMQVFESMDGEIWVVGTKEIEDTFVGAQIEEMKKDLGPQPVFLNCGEIKKAYDN